jgi:LacI family transcriptional regulator
VTIAEVARHADVSIPTVSKVINGRWGGADATVARVKAVIDELGYASSLGAASLRSRTTGVLAVLVTEIEPFSAELLKGVSRAVASTSYELLIYVGGASRSESGWERRYVARLGGTVADGAIIVTPTVSEFTAQIPIVAVDPHAGTTTVPSVGSDNEGGARTATEHLLALGHTRIALLGGRADLESARARERGFRAAMAGAGVRVDESLVLEGGYRSETSVGPLHALLERDDPPTAIFGANDQSAIEAIRVATELGLRVPSDLSIIGFDNIPESALSVPPLTTVAQAIHEMGEIAVQTLVRLISDEATDTSVMLPTMLVERQSCAPPRRT